MDVVPFARSPIRDFSGLPSSKFGLCSTSRDIPDGPKSFRMEQLESGISDEEGSMVSMGKASEEKAIADSKKPICNMVD